MSVRVLVSVNDITVRFPHDQADAAVLALCIDITNIAEKLGNLTASTTPGDIYRIRDLANEIHRLDELAAQLDHAKVEYRADRTLATDEETLAEMAHRLQRCGRSFARDAATCEEDEPAEAAYSRKISEDCLAGSRAIFQVLAATTEAVSA